MSFDQNSFPNLSVIFDENTQSFHYSFSGNNGEINETYYINKGPAFYKINGRAFLGEKLSLKNIFPDPNGQSDELEYYWQTLSENDQWINVGNKIHIQLEMMIYQRT